MQSKQYHAYGHIMTCAEQPFNGSAHCGCRAYQIPYIYNACFAHRQTDTTTSKHNKQASSSLHLLLLALRTVAICPAGSGGTPFAPCRAGTFSAGGTRTVPNKCTACPTGFTTSARGATSTANCTGAFSTCATQAAVAYVRARVGSLSAHTSAAAPCCHCPQLAHGCMLSAVGKQAKKCCFFRIRAHTHAYDTAIAVCKPSFAPDPFHAPPHSAQMTPATALSVHARYAPAYCGMIQRRPRHLAYMAQLHVFMIYVRPETKQSQATVRLHGLKTDAIPRSDLLVHRAGVHHSLLRCDVLALAGRNTCAPCQAPEPRAFCQLRRGWSKAAE